LKPNHALEAVVGAYKAARTRLMVGARRVDNPTPMPTAGPPEREVSTKRNKRKGANISAAPVDSPPAKRATRRTSRNVETKKDEPAVATRETRKSTRSSARATTGVEASTSGGGAWGRPIRASSRATGPTPLSETDTVDEEEEEDAGEADDEDYGGTQREDDDDDAVSESDLDLDDATRDEVVDLVNDEGGGGKTRRKLGGRQPTAPSTTPGGSDGKQRASTVQCPICGVGVQEGFINSHVDVCLTRGGAFGSAIAEAVGGGSSPKDEFGNENAEEQYAVAKLPRLVYHIMKDKPLRKLLSDAGLSSIGRREQMIERHKEFTLRVNATIDSGHRPNLAAIAREVSKLERDRDRAGMMPASGLVGSGGSGAAVAAVTVSRADVFGKLIADVRARRGGCAKARRNSSPSEESEDNGEDIEIHGNTETTGDEDDVRLQEEATEGGVAVDER